MAQAPHPKVTHYCEYCNKALWADAVKHGDKWFHRKCWQLCNASGRARRKGTLKNIYVKKGVRKRR